MSEPSPYPSVGSRLDRLPRSRTIQVIVLLISLGTFWDSYMLYSIGPISAHFLSSLGQQQMATAVPLALFFGTFVGAIALGRLSDRIGRKNAFTLNLSVLAFGNLLAVLSPNATLLLISLFVAGIGTGAEIPLSATYVQEFMSGRNRGKATSLMLAFGFLGGTAGAFLAAALAPLNNLFISGFRIALLIGAVGAVASLVIRARVPESPRWLERVGRTQEADAVMTEIENSVMRRNGLRELPPPAQELAASHAAPGRRKTLDLIRPPFLRRSLSAWLIELFQGFGAYGFTTFVPVILYAKGYSIVHALAYTAIIQISYPIGCVISSFVTDRIDRKWGMAIFYTLNMLSGVAFFFSDSVPMIILFGFLTELLIFIDGPLLHTYEVEIYPTDLRGRGSGISFAFSRLGGFLAPLAASMLLAVAGTAGSSLLIASAAGSWLLCAAFAALLAVRTGKSTLEELENPTRSADHAGALTAP